MTNERHDPTDDWALASAYVDGEADEHERALVEADPARRELVDRLTRVRADLAAPVAPPLGAGDAAIAAALGALDDRPAAAASATVPSLDHRRRRRMQWFAGAAAAAVIALLVGLVIRSGDDDGSTAVSKAPATTNGAVASRTETESAATDAATPAADASPSAGGAATAPASTAAPVLIVVDEPGQLLDLVVAGDRPTAAVATACTEPGEVVLAMITYRGTLAVATFDAAAHVRRARSLADCAVLAEIAATS